MPNLTSAFNDLQQHEYPVGDMFTQRLQARSDVLSLQVGIVAPDLILTNTCS